MAKMPYLYFQYVFVPLAPVPSDTGAFVTAPPGPFVPPGGLPPVEIAAGHQTIEVPTGEPLLVDDVSYEMVAAIISGADVAAQIDPAHPAGFQYGFTAAVDDVYATFIYTSQDAEPIGPGGILAPPAAIVGIYDEPTGQFLIGTGALTATIPDDPTQNVAQSDNANASGFIETTAYGVDITADGILALGEGERGFQGWYVVPPTSTVPQLPTEPGADVVAVNQGQTVIALALYKEILAPREGFRSGPLVRAIFIYQLGGPIIRIPGDASGGPNQNDPEKPPGEQGSVTIVLK
jgi:hypothetical protein